MVTKNPYAIYSQNKAMTANPGELTLMLFEGAIKFINMAMAAEEKHNIPEAHNNIMKTEKIIEELQASLDHKYEVAEDFARVYEYLHYRLVRSNISKNPADLEEVLGHVREMRDTWKEVMRKSREKAIV